MCLILNVFLRIMWRLEGKEEDEGRVLGNRGSGIGKREIRKGLVYKDRV